VRLYAIRNEVDCHESASDTNRDEEYSCTSNGPPLSDTKRGDIEDNYGSFPSTAIRRASIDGTGVPASRTNRFKQSCTMRLNHPNDELGSMLLLMTPQMVVHELDVRYRLHHCLL